MSYEWEHRYMVYTGPPDAPTDEEANLFADRCDEALFHVGGVEDAGWWEDAWDSDSIKVVVGFDGAADPDQAACQFAAGMGGLAVYRLADNGLVGKRLFDHRPREWRKYP